MASANLDFTSTIHFKTKEGEEEEEASEEDAHGFDEG